MVQFFIIPTGWTDRNLTAAVHQTGAWSDTSDERIENQDAVERFFKVLKRKVGGNATKRLFLSVTIKGEFKVDEISQEEVTDVNASDGTFFMSYDAWMQYFTHFFAGIGT